MDPDMESVYLCLLDPGSLACSTLPDFGYNGYFTFRCWKVTPSASASGGEGGDSGDTVCPGDNYVLRDVNTLCEEGTEVTDATTCETAAGQCGPYTWSSFDANSPAEMGGCFFRTVEGDVQYNTFGVRTVDAGMADRRPICFYIPTTETETTTFAGTDLFLLHLYSKVDEENIIEM